MNIGIDLDGTVADNLELLVETLNQHCGKRLVGDEIRQYDLCKTYCISEEEIIELMETREEEIIVQSPVVPMAREYIEKLAGQGWQIHIITARHPRYHEVTRRWLEKNDISFCGLHLLNSHNKLQICRNLAVKMMVEDNIHNAYQLKAGGIPTILYEAPHNRHWSWQGIRCKTWREIYQTILTEI